MIAILVRFLLLLLGAGAMPVAADTILVTEVVTDPQQDHSESAGGNAIPYDLFPGTGTVSSVDEFVELYNASDEAIDLNGYALAFLDTSPSNYVFGTTTAGVTRYSPGSSLNELLAGGFVLLGNPPGAINNKIVVEVYDPHGNKLDRVEIADGKAANAAGEAVARMWDGGRFLRRFFRDRITPLGPASPVPEPATVLLLAVSGAAASTRRRSRRASDQKRSETRRPRPCPA